MENKDFYGTDLAWVHDQDFSGIARNTAAHLKAALPTQVQFGRVLDLGCGSGNLAESLLTSRPELKFWGLDLSPEMIERAREKVPSAQFEIGSIFDTELPPADAICMTGEIVTYLIDSRHSGENLEQLFRRIYHSLASGGIFLFDFLEPGPESSPPLVSKIIENEGWTMFLQLEEDHATQRLTRDIRLFRKVGDHYRKSREIHHVQLFPQDFFANLLGRVGFEFKFMRHLAGQDLRERHIAVQATKS